MGPTLGRAALAAGFAIAGHALAQDANPVLRGASPHVRFSAESRAEMAAVERAVTGASPFSADCGDHDGILYISAEVEPHIAVDPLNANHLVGAWQQDRYSDGGARAIAWGTSFDGGLTWTRGVLPITPCSGGAYERASDPWVAFAPDGTVYQAVLAFSGEEESPSGVSAILVSRSTDGGLSWSVPITVRSDSGPAFNDKETITADPLDARYVYAVWDRLRGTGGSDTIFSRTTDGGATWEPARVIYQPQGQTISNLIRVLPDGTLVNMFMQLGGTPAINVMRSADRGASWSAPIRVDSSAAFGVVDPQTNTNIRDASIVPQMAVAPDGTLYIVWQDARFTQQHDSIAISRSTDGGLTWSAAVRVNAVPGVAAFIPQVHVSADGTIGVTYYDFRSNTSDPATLLTDFWLARSRNGVDWTETRVSPAFDLARAPFAGGLFLGDYTGLTSSGSTFLALYAKTTGDLQNRNDIFAARIAAASALDAKRAYRTEAMPEMEPGAEFWQLVAANAKRAFESRYLNVQR